MDNFVILTREGFFATRLSKITDPDAALKSYLSKRIAVVNNLFMGWGAAFSQDGNCITLFKVIPNITMITRWTISEEENGLFMIPTFSSSTNDMAKTMIWNPPDDMHILFSCSTTVGEYTRCSLWAIHTTTKRALRLPLPNLYTDSRICMGDDFFTLIRGKDIVALSECALSYVMNESNWNTDLLPDESRFINVFRWDKDFNQVACPDWPMHCYPVSVPDINAITEVLTHE